jgi:D-tyrosyl-tRNA(Tyr) deacylase
MRAVVQRATSARVVVDGEIVGSIERGLAVFLGAQRGDTDADLEYVLRKIAGLRVFQIEGERTAGEPSVKMGRSVTEVSGAILVVPQFTLFGDVRRGLRPSYDEAMEPEAARAMLDRFVSKARDQGLLVETGRFGADMQVRVDGDGPVTILVDSRKLF